MNRNRFRSAFRHVGPELTPAQILAFHKAQFGDARMDERSTDTPTRDPLIPGSLDDLRGRTPEELRKMLEVTKIYLRDLHETEDGELRDKTDDEQRAFDELMPLHDAIIKRIEDNTKVQDVLRNRPAAVKQATAAIFRGLDDSPSSVTRLTTREAREKALRVLGNGKQLRDDEAAQVDRLVRTSTDIARRVIVTENDAYRDAFAKLTTNPDAQLVLDDDERDAIKAWMEYRAMSEGTGNLGGFGVPVFIDPSIIMTGQGSGNPFLTLASTKDVNTSAWKGVNSGGVSWSFDAEASAVSDDSPTPLGQPVITVFTARGFIPYSIEVGEDYPGFASEMSTLLAEGYDELLVDKFSRGNGTSEPQGILTALGANTNVQVASTTDGAFGQEDVYKVWKALGQRFRRNSSWMMSVDINNRIRQFGTANVFHAYTQNLPAEWADQLFGKGVYESPYFPDFTGTTGVENRLVVGDWRNYVIARRGGMNVELVPQLFDITNNRPTGQRGWFAYSRIGGGSANDLAFRLLQNQ